MTATILPIDGDETTNETLTDLVWASFGDERALGLVRPDHVGTVMLVALVQHPKWVDYELAVLSYKGAGYQMFIGPRDDNYVACIDMHNAADSNAAPEFLDEVQRKVDLYLDDQDGLGADLMADSADIYRAA